MSVALVLRQPDRRPGVYDLPKLVIIDEGESRHPCTATAPVTSAVADERLTRQLFIGPAS